MTDKQLPEDKMPERINKIFSDQDLPAYTSLSEVEAMKKRISDLEKEIVKQEMALEDTRLQQSFAVDSQPQKKIETQVKRVVPTNISEPIEGEETFFKKIRRLFSAPIFVDDLKKTQSAKLLHQIITVIWALPILLITIGILGRRAEVIPPAIIISIMLTILMIFNRLGWVGLTGTLMTALIVLVFGFADFQNAGNIQPSTLIIAVAIILSGLLLGSRAPILTAILIAISHAMIVYFQIKGTIKIQSAPAVGYENIVITSIMTLIIGALFQFVISRLQLALDKARENEQELQISNQELQDLGIALEQRVLSRTRDLELASEVGRTVSSKVGSLSNLLNDAVELIRTNFNLYYTQVYITDRSGRTITLRAGTGDVGRQLLNRGHNLLISSNSLNGRAASERQTVVVANTIGNPNFLPNPLLPKTRSEMTIPLIAGNNVVGVLDMQSAEVNALNEENRPAFEALAGQLAIAIQNAALFEETEQSRRELEDQTKEQAYTNWVNFLNAIDRHEKVGYIYTQSQNEVVPFVNAQIEADQRNTLHTPITIEGAEIGSIHISDDPTRKWTSTDAAVINETAAQLSRHIENLRLLAQSDKYKVEAERISNRLTREGWSQYLATRNNLEEGFIYEDNKVQPLTAANKLDNKATQSYPIYVRDEHIGDLAVDPQDNDANEINDLISSVTQQLSSHIENLRLLEQTQDSRLEVQTSQERYELAVTGSNDGLWDWDIANNYIYYSPRWKSMLGFEDHELTKGFEDWERLIHPDDHDRATKSLNDYLEQKAEEYDVEVRLQHKDGTWRWIRDRGKALRKTDGSPYRMAGSHSDITQRKNDETALAQRASQLTVLNRVMEVANSSLDLQFILQTATDEFRNLMQAFSAGVLMLDEKGETLTLTTESYANPDMPKLVGRAMPIASNPATDKSIKSGNTVLVPYAQTDPILEPIHAIMRQRNIQSVLVTPLFSRNKIIGVFSIDTNDANRRFDTNDIALIETLAKQLASAIESIQLFEETKRHASALSTVAAVSTTTSTVLDPDKLLQTVVDLAKERFNLYHAHIYLADEAWQTLLLACGAGEVGRSMVTQGHAIQMNAEQSIVARAFRERSAIIVDDVLHEPGFLPNPSLPLTLAEMAVPMIVGDKVLGVFDVQSQTINSFSQEDASIYTALATQVAVALQNARLYVEQAATVTQLRELDRLKSSFLANMSHELRTPLNSILGFTDVMLEELDGPLTPNMDNDLKLIQKNGKHLLHLINDVLDMAKIESGKMNLVIEKFNLNEAIEDVMSITSSLANEKALGLFIEPESDKNVFIRADHTRLRQVLINLINNGVKFTEKGSVSVRVTHKGNDVLVAVTDTGLGIPTDHLESVFSEFTQVDSSTTRKAGGTGLGLPISRRLIEMHGGKLWAESNGETGNGSTFNILLPVEAVISEATASGPLSKK